MSKPFSLHGLYEFISARLSINPYSASHALVTSIDVCKQAYVTVYVLEVELISSFSFCVHCLFYVSVFYLRSVGYIAWYKLIWKLSSKGVALKWTRQKSDSHLYNLSLPSVTGAIGVEEAGGGGDLILAILRTPTDTKCKPNIVLNIVPASPSTTFILRFVSLAYLPPSCWLPSYSLGGKSVWEWVPCHHPMVDPEAVLMLVKRLKCRPSNVPKMIVCQILVCPPLSISTRLLTSLELSDSVALEMRRHWRYLSALYLVGRP